MPDVFGLRAFDSREPVVRLLPGEFQNTIRVLMPDATAEPRGFHDIILEDLANTPNFCARRRWPSSVFANMHKRQADMETLRRDCKHQYDSEFGGGRAGTCPHCGVHVMSNLSRHVIEYHLELGQLWRCPVRGVRFGKVLHRTIWIT